MTETTASVRAAPEPLTEPLTLTLDGMDLAALSDYRAARKAYVELSDDQRAGRAGERAMVVLRKAEKELALAIFYLARAELAD